MKRTEAEIGMKVRYTPFEGCDESLIENGIIKGIHIDDSYVSVVYKCDNNWDRYYDYTGAKTHVKDLTIGWKEELQEAI